MRHKHRLLEILDRASVHHRERRPSCEDLVRVKKIANFLAEDLQLHTSGCFSPSGHRLHVQPRQELTDISAQGQECIRTRQMPTEDLVEDFGHFSGIRSRRKRAAAFSCPN